MSDYRVITQDFVKVQISTSKDDMLFNERRFPKDITISDLKAKLELTTGGNCSTMEVEVYDKDDKHVCSLSDNKALLGYYPIEDGMRLHVVDIFSVRNELDFGKVEKFEISPEVYAKRTDTVRQFLIKNKLGQYNEDYAQKMKIKEEEEMKVVEATQIGARCQVILPQKPTRLGTVMYKGHVEGLSGLWIGVKYDEPHGKNDGTFNGKEYFKCYPKYGTFVRVKYVYCGDFPEEGLNLDEEI